MAGWAWVVVPAVLTALVIRIDAKLVGPYFALSSVISATEGLDGKYWYEERPLRMALIRRFVYPVLLGFALAWTHVGAVDTVAAGLLTAGLLLWPAVMNGLPWEVARRAWQLPALYLSLLVSFGALALGGRTLYGLLVYAADGDIRQWVVDEFVGTLITWIVVLIAVPAFRTTFLLVRSDSERRRAIGAERLMNEADPYYRDDE